MHTPLVSIILVNYNGQRFNTECIDSILQQSYLQYEIIFIDNNSTDTSVLSVENKYKNEILDKKLRIIKNKENVGFSLANNQGHLLSSDSSKYIRLLNNDTVVEMDTLSNMIKKINLKEDIGAISCVILDRGHENKIKSIYATGNVITSNYFGDSVLKKVSHEEIDNQLYYTSSLSGCSFLYRKDIISLPFPECYFAYGEDVWLSLHIISMGYKLAVDVKSQINHYGSGAFGKKPTIFKVFNGTKNQRINYLSFFGVKTTIVLLPLFIIIQLAQIFLSNPFLRIKGKFKAIGRLLYNYKKVIYQRNLTQKTFGVTKGIFLKQLSSKCTDNIYFGNFSKAQLFIIKCLNGFFNAYSNLCKIPHS